MTGAVSGHGPGTPYAVGASSKLVSALRRFDFDSGGAAALRETLDAARAADSLTLWHLVGRADEAGRAAVVRRARALGIALPAGVEAESLVRGDRRALSRWRTLLEPLWQTRGHQRLRRK